LHRFECEPQDRPARSCWRRFDAACEGYGAPRYIRSDNGPEFVANEVRKWVEERQIGTIYIEPGSPWQNGYVESFHSRFRNDCLNREWFMNELDAKVAIAEWREKDHEPKSGSGREFFNH
jgi:putative transposase